LQVSYSGPPAGYTVGDECWAVVVFCHLSCNLMKFTVKTST
jgi:hypothetical protein